MPYLNCPGCRLTIYSGPKAVPPRLCTRCGARLGGPVRSLFKSTRPGAISGSRVLETLRERRTASQTQLERGPNRPAA
jgi:hypothetical protein